MVVYQDIIKDIVSKKLNNFYFLYGEEPYYMDKLVENFLSRAISEEAKDFDLSLSFGADETSENIVANCLRYPMMNDRLLVIVREAQECRTLAKLTEYIPRLPETTTLVLCYSQSMKDIKAGIKKLMEQGIAFESKPLEEKKVTRTIEALFAQKGLMIEPKAAQMMGEHTSTSIISIVSEVEKISIALQGQNRKITEDDIEKYIGVSKEYNYYELEEAIVECNSFKAFNIVKHFEKNEKNYPVQRILPSLFEYFSDLLILHYLPELTVNTICKALGLRESYRADKYVKGLKNYSVGKVFNIVRRIRVSDAESKGFYGRRTNTEVLMDLLFYIFL